MIRIACLSLALLAGCAPLPDVERTVSAEARGADFPALVEIVSLLQAGQSVTISSSVTRSVEARAAGLRARAAALRGPIIEAPIRRRMQNALSAYPARVADPGGAG